MDSFKQFSYHHLFLILGLIFGLKMVFVNPPWQSNDEDRHFFNAYNLSEGHVGPQEKDSVSGFMLPTKLYGTILSFQAIKFNENKLLSHEKINDIENQELDLEKKEFVAAPNCKINPFPYIPAAIMIKAGSIFKGSAVWLGWWGRIGSLFAYLGIIYFAIKMIPAFKPILLMIALSPMALYQGTSVSYDSLSMAFLFLFFALIITYYFQEHKITFRQILILCLVALAQRLSKDGYFIVFFSAAFIPMSKFENKALYWGTFVLMLMATFLPSQLWAMYLNQLHLPPEPSFQKDYLFDLSKNLSFHLNDPIHAAYLIALNVLEQGQLLIHGSIGRFGYVYYLLPFPMMLFYLLSMLFVVMSEKVNLILPLRFRLPIALLALMNCLAIIVMFFLTGTAVGANYVFGLQGRYFTPLLPFLIVFLFYLPKPIIKYDYTKILAPFISSAVLIYTLNHLESFFYFSTK
jgi:uncharacterized membrane protein